MGGQRSDLPALGPPAGMQPFSVNLRALLLLVLFPWPGAGQFHVIGPRAPVIALFGEEAVLSCQLSPPMDAQNMEVRWYRNDPLGLVHHYSTSQNDMEEQMPEYQGRTEFLKEDITKGHVALRIHSIQPSDGGEYVCFFESSTYYNDAKFEVLVTGSGMVPHIHIEPGDRRGIKLTCTSTGWYPEPEMQWRDHQGLHLAPTSETKKREENGLFHVESSLTVDKSSRAEVSCVVRNPILHVEKGVHVSMADALFPEHCPWTTGLAIILSLLAVGTTIILLVLLVLLVCARKAKGSLKKEHGELQEEHELLIKEKALAVGKSKVKAPADLVSESPLPGQLHEELERIKLLGKEGLAFARRYAENVTLDPETAHPYLQVAEDKKSVKAVDPSWKQLKTRQQFDNLICVLGEQIFCEGRHYWEVNVKNKMKWTLGICKDSVCRQGEITVSPETGFWTLCLKKCNDYQALASTRITVHFEEPPEIIGIFLDYEAGRVSFYNVNNLSHIYTYKQCFTEALRPYFYPGPLYNGQNAHPLTIQSLGI